MMDIKQPKAKEDAMTTTQLIENYKNLEAMNAALQNAAKSPDYIKGIHQGIILGVMEMLSHSESQEAMAVMGFIQDTIKGLTEKP
jgi:hypothetical protein